MIVGIPKEIKEEEKRVAIALARGLNTYGGKIAHAGVATAFGLSVTPLKEVIGA